MPLGYQLTLTETLLSQVEEGAPVVGPGDWEVGRLVLSPAYRTDVDALRHCLRMALEYARESAHVHRLFATCTHVLSRLYRRFGFSVVARDLVLPGTGKEYTLINGSWAAVAAGLRSTGAGAPQ